MIPFLLKTNVLTNETDKAQKIMVISWKAEESNGRVVDLLNEVFHECLLSAIQRGDAGFWRLKYRICPIALGWAMTDSREKFRCDST